MTGSVITVTGRRGIQISQALVGKYARKAILQAFKGDSEHRIPCTVKISIEIDRRQKRFDWSDANRHHTHTLVQLCSAPAIDRRKAGLRERSGA
jgi:hypothetical protein